MRAGWAAEGAAAGWAGPLDDAGAEAALDAAALTAAMGLPVPDLVAATTGGFWKSCAVFATRRVHERCVGLARTSDAAPIPAAPPLLALAAYELLARPLRRPVAVEAGSGAV